MKSIHGFELLNFSYLISDGLKAVREIVKIFNKEVTDKVTDKMTISEKASIYRASFKNAFDQDSRIIDDASDEIVFCAMDVPEEIRHDSRCDAQMGILGTAFVIGTAPTLASSAPLGLGCLAAISLYKLFCARAKEREAVEMVNRSEGRMRDAVTYGRGVNYNSIGEIQRWV